MSMNDPNKSPQQRIQKPYSPPMVRNQSCPIQDRDRLVELLATALKPLAEFPFPNGDITVDFGDRSVILGGRDSQAAKEALHMISLYQK